VATNLALATFTAKLCRRYSAMDIRPILMYLLRQLHSKDSSDIIMLRELLTHMAGIAQLSNLTPSQVERLGGGPCLRVSVFGVDEKRDQSSRSAKRFVDALQELGIVCELFILLAQIRANFVYQVPDNFAHQKVLAYRYDEMTHILNQYTEMVNDNLDAEQFKTTMLSIPELCITYNVQPSLSFGLWRSVLGEEIRKGQSMEADEDGKVSLPKKKDLRRRMAH
jgi:THO complex subunit 2